MEHPKHDDSDLFDERYDEEGIRYLAEAMAHIVCKEDLIIYATDGLKHSLEDDYGFFKESWTKYMDSDVEEKCTFVEEEADRARELQHDAWANESINQSESDMY